MAKHRAGTATSPLHIRGLLSAASIFAVAIFMGLTATGGTYALWNTTASIPGGTVTTGSAELKINNLASYTVPALAPAKLYPGRSIVSAAPMTFSNTGTTKLLFTAASTVVTVDPTFSGWVDIVLTAATTCSPSAAGSTPVSASVTIAAGAAVSMCLEVRLKASAPASVQGRTVAFSVAVNATQVRP